MRDSNPGVPGFEWMYAAGGILIAIYLVLRENKHALGYKR